jgi:hypothetical protein
MPQVRRWRDMDIGIAAYQVDGNGNLGEGTLVETLADGRCDGEDGTDARVAVRRTRARQ